MDEEHIEATYDDGGLTITEDGGEHAPLDRNSVAWFPRAPDMPDMSAGPLDTGGLALIHEL